MDDELRDLDTWVQRSAPWAGVLFAVAVLLLMIDLAGVGALPSDAPPTVWGAVVRHPHRFLAGAYDGLAYTVLFLVYLSTLWCVLRTGVRDAVLSTLLLTGGVGGILLHALSDSALGGVLAIQSLTLRNPFITYGLFAFYNGVAILGDVFLAVFLLAATALILRGAPFPRWLAWNAALGALLFLVASLGLGGTHGRGLALALTILDLVGLLLFLLFVGATGVVMVRRGIP